MTLLTSPEKDHERVNFLDGSLRDSDASSETRMPRCAAPPMVAAMSSFRGEFE
jgi:hypothetical protein